MFVPHSSTTNTPTVGSLPATLACMPLCIFAPHSGTTNQWMTLKYVEKVSVVQVFWTDTSAPSDSRLN